MASVGAIEAAAALAAGLKAFAAVCLIPLSSPFAPSPAQLATE